MKLTYIIDPKYDSKLVFYMLNANNDPSGSKNRAERMGIDKETLDKIQKSKKYSEVKDVIEKISSRRYKKYKKNLYENRKLYQKEWDKINDIFFNSVQVITKMKWSFEEYEVVLSVFHPGISTRNENRIVRWIFEKPKDQLRITAHEILMSHIWQYFYKRFDKKKVEEDKNRHFWALNEITTVAILGLEPDLNELWFDNKKGYNKFLQNYPQLKKLQEKLREKYKNKKSFKEFIKQATKYISERFIN